MNEATIPNLNTEWKILKFALNEVLRRYPLLDIHLKRIDDEYVFVFGKSWPKCLRGETCCTEFELPELYSMRYGLKNEGVLPGKVVYGLRCMARHIFAFNEDDFELESYNMYTNLTGVYSIGEYVWYMQQVAGLCENALKVAKSSNKEAK